MARCLFFTLAFVLSIIAGEVKLPSGDLAISMDVDFQEESDLAIDFYGAEELKNNKLGLEFHFEERDDKSKRSSISLSLDGVVLENRPIDVKFAGKHKMKIALASVCGGYELSIFVDGKPNSFYSGLFVADVIHPLTRISYCDEAVSNVDVQKTGQGYDNSEPVEVSWEGKGFWNLIDTNLELPSLAGIGRVVLEWTLIPQKDPWDRVSRLYVEKEGRRFEVARMVTSYNMAGGSWKQDITPIAKLLTGNTKLLMRTDGGFGWNVKIRYYKGQSEQIATDIIPLWNGDFKYGTPTSEGLEGVEPMEVQLSEGSKYAKFYSITTGHVWAGNVGHGAEFIKKWRKLKVGKDEYTNLLWCDDNEFNPIDKQGGTWFADRAGWRPGCVVQPWVVDLPIELGQESIKLEYIAEPYKANYNKDAANASYPATHFLTSYLLIYR